MSTPELDATLAELHTSDLAEARAFRDAQQLSPGTLTEVIVHGAYEHRRETSVGSAVSAAELADFVNGSPYVNRELSEENLQRMLAETRAEGETDHGWSRFYLN